jgi:precorrin-6B methylase 2
MRVVDLSRGAGDLAVFAAEIVGPTTAVIGIDRNATAIAMAREGAHAAGHANASALSENPLSGGPNSVFMGRGNLPRSRRAAPLVLFDKQPL